MSRPSNDVDPRLAFAVIAIVLLLVFLGGKWAADHATGDTVRAIEQGGCPDGYVQAPSHGTANGRPFYTTQCVPRHQ